MEPGNGLAKIDPVNVQINELVVRWIPSTGAVQVGSNLSDPVLQLGMLEMAKVALIEQRVLNATGKGSPVIVPGRFAS